MKRAFLVLLLIFFSCKLGISGYAQGEASKAAFIIAQNNFRDEEFLRPKEILERAGIQVSVVSTTLNYAQGMLGTKVKPDILISAINIRDFDAVVFIGGIGASQYWNDPAAHKLAQETVHAGKILAAICIAPVTLARAGILEGKRATVWFSESSKLEAAGAEYTAQPVQRDGNIITAAGPFAARQFAEELVKALSLR